MYSELPWSLLDYFNMIESNQSGFGYFGIDISRNLGGAWFKFFNENFTSQ